MSFFWLWCLFFKLKEVTIGIELVAFHTRGIAGEFLLGYRFAADVNYLNLTADHIGRYINTDFTTSFYWIGVKLSLHPDPGLKCPGFFPRCSSCSLLVSLLISLRSISPTRSKTTNSLSAAMMPTQLVNDFVAFINHDGNVVFFIFDSYHLSKPFSFCQPCFEFTLWVAEFFNADQIEWLWFWNRSCFSVFSIFGKGCSNVEHSFSNLYIVWCHRDQKMYVIVFNKILCVGKSWL